MNNRKKIIETLRSADKASVDKLMEEAARKDEIFAKAMKRAENDSEYTDIASGVEQYNRRIRITHIASAAAAAVLVVAGIIGGAHLLRKNDNLIHDGGGNGSDMSAVATTETTTAAADKVSVTTAAPASGYADITGVSTSNDALSSGTTNTVTAETVTTEANSVPTGLTGEFLRQRCIDATHYYDRFSAEFEVKFASNFSGPDGPYYDVSKGTVKIDNTTMTGEMNCDEFYGTEADSGKADSFRGNHHSFYLNNLYVESANNGMGANAEFANKYCYIKDISHEFMQMLNIPDRVFFNNCGIFKYIYLDDDLLGYSVKSEYALPVRNMQPWTVTGDRIENGRRIASVAINYEYDFGGWINCRIDADVDVETGLWLSYELYYEDLLDTSFRAWNYKFNDDAEAPMTAAEARDFLERNRYEVNYFPGFPEYKISDIV